MRKMPRKRVRRDKLSCLAMAFKADRQLGKENIASVSFTNTLSLENYRAQPKLPWESGGGGGMLRSDGFNL